MKKDKLINKILLLFIINIIIVGSLLIYNLFITVNGLDFNIAVSITLFVLLLPVLGVLYVKKHINVPDKNIIRIIKIVKFYPSVFILLPFKYFVILENNLDDEMNNHPKEIISKKLIDWPRFVVRILFLVVFTLSLVICLIFLLSILIRIEEPFFLSKFILLVFALLVFFIYVTQTTYKTLLEIKMERITINTIYRLMILSRQAYNTKLNCLVNGKNADVIYELE